MRENKGITLITLAVTIIVLIILAGVSINMLVGDNGIISMAQKAKENTELAKMEEEEQLDSLYEELNSYNSISFPSEGNEQLEELQNKFNELKEEYDNLQTEYGTFKTIIAEAITQRGIETPVTATAETMAKNINNLPPKKLEEGEFTLTLGPRNISDNIVIYFENEYEEPPMIEIKAELISGNFAPYVNIPSVTKEEFSTYIYNGAGVNSGTEKFTWIAYEK